MGNVESLNGMQEMITNIPKEKQMSHFDQVNLDNKLKAEFDEQVEEKSLDVKVHKRLIDMSYEWRHVELAAVSFSILGLVLAITDFEINLNHDGFRGLLLLHDNGPNTQEDIDKAINDRQNIPKT
jgi:hypothetical protein